MVAGLALGCAGAWRHVEQGASRDELDRGDRTGVGLGLVYFGGLWLTVRRVAGPAGRTLVAASGAVRSLLGGACAAA